MANGTRNPKAPAKGGKTAAKDDGPKTVPAFKDKDGALLKLRRKDFPRTKEGKLAFCDYQVARWEDRKVRIEKASDPLAKAKKKLESYKKKMKEMEELIAKGGG